MYYWFMLLLAIITEVTSTSFLNLAVASHPVAGYSLMAVLISLSYYCLAQAVKKIPLALAYALWEGVGLLLISLVSWLLFDEPFSLAKQLAIAVLLCGLVLMNLGEWLAGKNKTTPGTP